MRSGFRDYRFGFEFIFRLSQTSPRSFFYHPPFLLVPVVSLANPAFAGFLY